MANPSTLIGQELHRRLDQLLAAPVSNSANDQLGVIDDLARGRWAGVCARFDDTMRAGLTEEGLGLFILDPAAASGIGPGR